MNTIHVDVVSAEESIFSGEAKFVALPGEAGELGIYPRHTPLISRIKAGSVRIEKADGTEEFIFVAGGILEVQPNCVTVLSDTAVPVSYTHLGNADWLNRHHESGLVDFVDDKTIASFSSSSRSKVVVWMNQFVGSNASLINKRKNIRVQYV